MSRRIIGVRRGDSVQERIREPVQNLAGLRLVPTNDVNDKAVVVVEDTGGLYRFNYEGGGADDGSLVIEPTAGPGRWLLMNPSGTSLGSERLRFSAPVLADSIITQTDWPVDNITVIGIQVYVDVQPATTGVYELTITGNGNNLLQAPNIDLTSLTAGTIHTFPLTSTTADLDLAALVLIEMEFESDNVDLTGSAVELAIVYQLTAVLGSSISPEVERTVLSSLQLESGGIRRATLVTFDPILLASVPADGDTLTLDDGTTTETYTFRTTPSVAFDVNIGADVLDTLNGLEATILSDSVQWVAQRVTDIDRFHSNTAATGHGVVIARNTLSGSDTDRIYASVTALANIKVAMFHGETNYSDSEIAVTPPTSDPGSGDFFGYSEDFPRNGSLRITLADPELYSFQRRLPNNLSTWVLIGPIPGGGGASNTESFTSAEAHIIGDVLASNNSGDTVLSSAIAANGEFGIIGVSTQTVGIGAAVDVHVLHGRRIAINFISVPGATVNGDIAYLSTTDGKATVTPPSSPGDVVMELGVIVGADGALSLVDVIWAPQFVEIK
jgi:hypothetical protein